MKYLITGLGNIGSEYLGTRHNIGFRVVNALAKRPASLSRKNVRMHRTDACQDCELIILKPNTFMNLSGNAVRYWLQKENIPVENLLVVVDDLALPFGTLRLKPKGKRCRTQRIEEYPTVVRHTRIQPPSFRHRQRFPAWRTDQLCAWQVSAGRAPGDAGKDETGGRNHQKFLPGRHTEYNEPIQ